MPRTVLHLAAKPGEDSQILHACRRHTILMDAPIQVTLSVVDSSHQPVGGATVNVRDTGADRGATFAKTDARGTVEIGPLLPARTYEILVSPPSNRRDLAPVRIDHWSPASADTIQLPRGRTLTGRVVDGDENPVGDSWIWYRTPTTGRWSVVGSQVNGNFSIPSLPDEEVTLVVVSNDAPGSPPAATRDPTKAITAPAGSDGVILRLR